MAIGWMSVLQLVPWGEVIRNAPQVAEGAKKLWKNVAGQEGTPPPSAPATAAAPTDLASLQVRLSEAEQALAALHEQMLASSEIIRALADQNTQLVQRVEAHRVRVKWLTLATVLLAVLALGSAGVLLLAP
jgi:hypothetical protein